jgi:hypothetical protein
MCVGVLQVQEDSLAAKEVKLKTLSFTSRFFFVSETLKKTEALRKDVTEALRKG